MEILEHIKLAEYTTFHIGGPARYYCVVKNDDELKEAVSFAKKKKQKIFVLGGGSNILISDNGFFGLVIKMEYTGIEWHDKGDHVIVEAAAGEMWDKLVDEAVERKLYGIENLSAIPGTVGAAPIQNIGAYGADVSTSVVKVRVFDVEKNKFLNMTNKDCAFEYRDSIFKKNKERFIVTSLTLKLLKNGKVNIEYRDLQTYFKNKNNMHPTLEEVRKAVIEIRWNKLPDWKLWGTAGSFFKNPIISKEHYAKLIEHYPDLPGFPEPDGRIKVPLGWIIDKVCKMKGAFVGQVGTYDKQALVIVTKPGARAEEVVQLAHKLIDSVKQKTGIEVEGEVEWVN